MKRTILFTLLALLGMTQAAAQDYEYVPFVREGVKWVYCIDNPFSEEFIPLPIAAGTSYYSFEMKGDAMFNGKHYKPVILYYIDESGKEIAQDIVPVYVREEDKVVYAYHPDGITYLQCPVGYGGFANQYGWASFFYPMEFFNNEEFILYDFNHPDTFYQPLVDYLNQHSTNDYMAYLGADFVEVGEHICKRHSYKGYEDTENVIIEGIGFDSYDMGDLLTPFTRKPDPDAEYQEYWGLSHVIKDGKIIYKGMRYREPQPEAFNGDYNGDGLVNITDVTTLINLLLQGGTHQLNDMNGDGALNIGDVTTLINYLLTH